MSPEKFHQNYNKNHPIIENSWNNYQNYVIEKRARDSNSYEFEIS